MSPVNVNKLPKLLLEEASLEDGTQSQMEPVNYFPLPNPPHFDDVSLYPSNQSTQDLSENDFCTLHCRNCISIWCHLSSFSSSPTTIPQFHGTSVLTGDTISTCPVIDCPNLCGARLHQCKVADHLDLICPLAEVECLSGGYGCPLVMPRYQLGPHLANCPASIVHCTIEWNRWPRCSGEKRPCLETTSASTNTSAHRTSSHSTDLATETFCDSEFDVALASRDQLALEVGMRVPKQTQRALRNNLTQRYPAMPMVSQTCRHVRGNSEPPCSACSSESTNSSSSDPLIPGLSSSVCRRLFGSDPRPKLLGLSSQAQPPTDDPSIPVTPLSEEMTWAINDRSLQVDCLMEFFPRYQNKPRAIYTFLCASDVRRGEFADHYKLHCDIYCNVDGWMEQRCPLAYSGCPYILQRLQPNRPDCNLVYSSRLSSFSLRYPCIQPPSTTSTSKHRAILLTDLPNELLIRIARYVDNFTLHSLSRSCSRLESICRYLLPSRGSVTLLWERVRQEPTGLVSWTTSRQIWFFTCTTDHISKWCFTRDCLTGMRQHLQECAYYERRLDKAPFCCHKAENFPFSSSTKDPIEYL